MPRAARRTNNKVNYDNETTVVDYIASPTSRRFHASNAFFRGIRGPFGSGKSTTCIMEVYTRALEQEPFRGVRRSRFALIRKTYPELLSTTLKSWQMWVPPTICPITMSPIVQGFLNVDLPDGTKVESEIIFLALDSEASIDKLKSLELTGAFLNEASELDEGILEVLSGRIRRYPPKKWGGYSWSGIIADTNSPDDGHWWYKLAEVEKPLGYEFFDQPPAIIPVKGTENDRGIPEFVPNDGTHGFPPCENVENQNAGYDYWLQMAQGKDMEWIKVFLMNEYGSLFTGRKVYPEFSDTVHVSKDDLKPLRGLPLLLAFDFGLTPACAFMQLTPKGQLLVIDELVAEDMGIEQFASTIVKPYVHDKFRGMAVQVVGDPAGSQRSQTNETTCFEILELQGFRTVPAPSNNFVVRREAVARFLTRLIDGKPGFLLSPRCEILRRGFLGGYHYRKFRNVDGEKYADRPDKNEFSHIHDALQYGCCYFFSGSPMKSEYASGMMHRQARKVVHRNTNGWT